MSLVGRGRGLVLALAAMLAVGVVGPAPAQATAVAVGLDASFDPGTGPNSGINALAVQPDGKVIIGGEFTSYGDTLVNRITRLNPNGSLDASFTVGTGFECRLSGQKWGHCAVWAIALQPDGKILVSGDFTHYNGIQRIRTARLNADGTLDTSFNPLPTSTHLYGTGGTSWAPLVIAVQDDGKILIGGDFSVAAGDPRNYIARLNTDGTLDEAFNPAPAVGAGGAGRALVYSIALQPDGKILIGGEFTSYNGTARSRIARLNADGSLDVSFDPGTGANGDVGMNSVAVLPDGKTLISGAFTSYNGAVANRIARLNTNGSLDTTFNSTGTGANGSISALALQPDGHIFIVGALRQYNGVTRNHLARLNTDGSLDTTFDPGAGTNQPVGLVKLQSNGRVLIAGDFTSYGEASRNRIARLAGTPGRPLNVGVVAGDGQAVVSWQAPEADGGSPVLDYTVTSSNGGPSCTTTQTTCTLQGLANGTDYTFQVTARNAVGSGLVSASTNPVTPVTPALTPSFGSVSRGGSGFSVPVTNFDPLFTWGVSSTAGSVSMDGAGAVTVSGLPAGQSATVTVTTSRPGFAQGSSSVTGQALSPVPPPGPGPLPPAPTPTPSPSPSPSPSPTPSPSPSPSPTPPPVPEVVADRPGEAVVQVVDEQGRPVAGQGPVSVAPVQAWNGVEVRSSEWDLLLQGVEANGAPAPLNRSGHLEVEQGRGLATRGSGFAPGTPVAVYVLGWPEPLGVITADEQGFFSARVGLPASVPVGVRTVQVTGATPRGHVLTVSLGIQVSPASEDPLIRQLPERVEVMQWMRVVREGGGEVVIAARSQGCSAAGATGSQVRDVQGDRLVFWGVGTCRVSVRDDNGRTLGTYQIAVVADGPKPKGVKPLARRMVEFENGKMLEESRDMLGRVRERVIGSPASYAYWMESKDRARTQAVTRMHADVARVLKAPRMRTIEVADSWQDRFRPGAFSSVTIAWLPVKKRP